MLFSFSRRVSLTRNLENADKILQAVDARMDGSSDELLSLLYQELRALARSMLAQYPSGQTLQATALVHEAYLRLGPQADSCWDGRAHYFGAAARAMRRILVEQARRKKAVKHGGDLQRIVVEPENLGLPQMDLDFLVLDQVLEELQLHDERKAEVFLLKFLTVMTNQETADALGVSVPTIERDWRFAKAFIMARMEDTSSDEHGDSHGS